MGGCHGDRRPHVLGVSFWSKDPIVLVLSCLQYARLPGTGASHPSRTHIHTPALSETTRPTPTHIIEVQQFGFNSINCTFTKMIQVLKDKSRQTHSVTVEQKKRAHEPSLCFFSLQAVAAINKAELPHIYIIPTLDSSIIS